jgi:hypothetical protein
VVLGGMKSLKILYLGGNPLSKCKHVPAEVVGVCCLLVVGGGGVLFLCLSLAVPSSLLKSVLSRTLELSSSLFCLSCLSLSLSLPPSYLSISIYLSIYIYLYLFNYLFTYLSTSALSCVPHPFSSLSSDEEREHLDSALFEGDCRGVDRISPFAVGVSGFVWCVSFSALTVDKDAYSSFSLSLSVSKPGNLSTSRIGKLSTSLLSGLLFSLMLLGNCNVGKTRLRKLLCHERSIRGVKKMEKRSMTDITTSEEESSQHGSTNQRVFDGLLAVCVGVRMSE